MKTKMTKFFDVDVKAAEDGKGYWFTASTSARDRQGDIIVQNGWKTADFMKNPVILWAHNYYETPIGKATEIKISNDSISAKIEFVPEEIDAFAGKVEKLVAKGYLKTVSVGFMVYKSEPLTSEDLLERPEMKYGSRLYGDLLEISVVPVPANPEALNENAFGEVVARGFGMKQDEAKSKFLPYVNAKGEVDGRLLRASVAAAHGARGGVKITDADQHAAINHLFRVAKQNNIELPADMHNVDLKKEFSDVWHEELLDVIQRATESEEEVTYALIKGEKRNALVIARDALNSILSLTEIEDAPKQPKSDEPQSDVDTASLLRGIVANLSDINARLK